jgi:hypothetical protein
MCFDSSFFCLDTKETKSPIARICNPCVLQDICVLILLSFVLTQKKQKDPIARICNPCVLQDICVLILLSFVLTQKKQKVKAISKCFGVDISVM